MKQWWNCKMCFSSHSYTPVFEFVSSFLNKVDEQDGRAAAILRLGATEDFIKHFQPTG